MKSRKYYTDRTVVERGKFDTCTPSTHLHDRSLSWLATDSSIKKGVGVKLVFGSNSVVHKTLIRHTRN